MIAATDEYGQTCVLVHNADCFAFFAKNNIHVQNHAIGRILYRNNTRGITDAGIIKAYTKGTLYYNPSTKNYIRYDNATGVAVAVDAPVRGSVVTVFQQNNPSPKWVYVRWRSGL